MSPDSSSYHIQRLQSDEAEQVRDRLQVVGMMWEDIDLERSKFWAARYQGDLVGFARLESDAPHALLGSLYVEPSHREEGVGRRLVQVIETEAGQRNIEQLFLFSTDAGGFFQGLGYEEIAVAETVEKVKNTPQAEWYHDHPDLLQKEITFVKELGA